MDKQSYQTELPDSDLHRLCFSRGCGISQVKHQMEYIACDHWYHTQNVSSLSVFPSLPPTAILSEAFQFYILFLPFLFSH